MTVSLPISLPDDLLWDVNESDVSWEEHQDFLVRRILTHGNWDQIRSLRRHIGDAAILDYITHTRGRGLDPKPCLAPNSDNNYGTA